MENIRATGKRRMVPAPDWVVKLLRAFCPNGDRRNCVLGASVQKPPNHPNSHEFPYGVREAHTSREACPMTTPQ